MGSEKRRIRGEVSGAELKLGPDLQREIRREVENWVRLHSFENEPSSYFNVSFRTAGHDEYECDIEVFGSQHHWHAEEVDREPIVAFEKCLESLAFGA